jgi:hypothetical protein
MFTMFDNILIIELWVGALQLDRKEPNLCEFIVFFLFVPWTIGSVNAIV